MIFLLLKQERLREGFLLKLVVLIICLLIITLLVALCFSYS